MNEQTAMPLSGCRVALAESRELDALVRLLEEEGAAVIRCPLVAILDPPDPSPVESWLRRLTNGEFEDAIFYTGEGIRRLLAQAERIGLKDQVVAALGKVRKITRGPKPARALKEIGLAPDQAAKSPTTDGLIAAYAGEAVAGRSIGMQHYNLEGKRELIDYLIGQGAKVDVVVPYIYAPASDADHVAQLITDLEQGKIDVIAFTSASQWDRLMEVAKERGLTDALHAGLARTRVASVGPIMDEALSGAGVRIDIRPDGPFFMRPLVNAMIADLTK